jgi:hypothetical protein
MHKDLGQGDQIGIFFAHWEIVSFGQFCENYKSSPNFWANFFRRKSNLDKKMGWATFWAIFAQTHLVTLIEEKFSKLLRSQVHKCLAKKPISSFEMRRFRLF